MTAHSSAKQCIGRFGKATETFAGGGGAILIDAVRWPAVVIDGSAPAEDDMLEVTAADGGVLKVRLAPGSLLLGAAPKP